MTKTPEQRALELLKMLSGHFYTNDYGDWALDLHSEELVDEILFFLKEVDDD